MRGDIILVGLGAYARARYIPLIEEAVSSGRASALHVVELDSARDNVDAFFRTRACKPASVSSVPDLRRRAIWYSGHGEDVLTALARPETKVIIATEPKAHLGYLRSALGLGLDCLVDKPVILPMGSNGLPAADRLIGAVAELKEICDRTGGRCVVMTPRRYNAVYELIGRYARRASRNLGTPVTYIGIEHHAGVWNTEEEILSREDHPYRYGYGMLCHSGYHYIDILSGLLAHNEEHFGRLAIELDVHRASAADQVGQIGPDPVRRLRGDAPVARLFPAPPFWGETDIVSSGAARRPGSRETVCLFRLDLLQTSVSLRNWRQLPTDVYNKNGRYGSETIRLNIGPFAAIEARIFKRPHLSTEAHPQLRREAHITLWRNAGFLGGAVLRERRYPARDTLARNADLGAGRKRLFDDWLAGRSDKSSLDSHTRTISLFAHYLAALTTDGANREEAAPSRAFNKVPA
jgi:predicted dehydrogenase